MHKLLSTLTLTAAMALAAPAQAADPVNIPADVFIESQTSAQYLARDELIGIKVHDKDGKIIGDIEDLILNDANVVEGIIMGTGGFLGIAEKRIGVHLSALQYVKKDGKTIVTIPEATKGVLEAMPEFVRAKAKKSLIERAMEKAKELSDKGSVTATDAYEKAKEKATPALEAAKEKASEAYSAAKEGAKKAIDKAKEVTDDAKEAATPEDGASAPADNSSEAPAN